MQLEPGLVVADRYRLLEELGRGGMGSVWRAYQKAIDAEVAIKFIETSAEMEAESRERFQREAKAAAKLRSAHVVQVFDHGEWQGLPYIVMELLDGEDLRRRLNRQDRLTPSECVGILRQAARALGRAHEAGIVHRDLKPDNLFLVREGDSSVVKVLDFGIAKLGPSILELDQKTQTGALLGTPHYMSPEHARSTRSVDYRADLWALAVIAYECLAGRRPFDGESLGDLLLCIMVDPLPTLTKYAPELPPPVDAWWQRAASRDSEQRYPSAKALVEALAEALGVHDHADVPAPPVMPRRQLSHADVPERDLTVKPVTSDSRSGRVPPPAPPPSTRGRAGILLAFGLASFAILGLVIAGAGHLLSRALPTSAASVAPADTVRPVASPVVSTTVSAAPTVSGLPLPSTPVSAPVAEATPPLVPAHPVTGAPGVKKGAGAAVVPPTKAPPPPVKGSGFNYGAL